jgi:hypothetical protein
LTGFLTTFILALAASNAPAALLWTNGTPNTSVPNSRGITIFRVADDFTLNTAASLESIGFGMVAEPGHFSGSITYAFYQNSAGNLGAVIDTATVSGITPVLVNDIPGNIHSVYRADFNLPSALALGAGTYWLELHDGASLTANNPNALNVLWQVVASPASTNAKQNPIPTLPSNTIPNEQVFDIFGTASTTSVPEPATTSLCLLGLGALIIFKRPRA